MNAIQFTEDFKETPFWWERTPPQEHTAALPGRADVLVIGSGYTGLSAAIQTARHGRHTVVVDAAAVGWGCSTRNGGQVSTSLKPTYQQLAKKYGGQVALEILQEGNNALDWIEAFIRDNEIRCDFARVGRFHAAHTPKALVALKQKIAAIPSALNIGAYAVEPQEQHREIGSESYHGGVVYPHHASLDPGRYHRGLLECAQAAGAEVVSYCRVEDIVAQGGVGHGKGGQGKVAHSKGGQGKQGRPARFRVRTTQGVITARDVVVATSGYTSTVTPWQQRRIFPVGTHIIATEGLPAATIARLIPNNRVVTDTRKMVMYYRICPEGRRILFGGRISLRAPHPRRNAAQLRQQMVRLFPELESARISHSWMGYVGYTFDEMPHTGQHGGMYYSMGYCGSGISLASYFGMRTGLKVIGDARGNTALDKTTFAGRFYYRQNPWFLVPAILYYRWQDEHAGRY